MAAPFFPEGRSAAVSLTFDDARLSQVDRGLPLLGEMSMRATFYVSLAAAEKRVAGWRQAVAEGHEIGNHTVSHPCSGNFAFARSNALEDYTLDRMQAELVEADEQIERMLGVRPSTFAYPCGQTFVGRGIGLQSYIPLVARRFRAGRLFMSEWHNAPAFCDQAQLLGVSCDNVDFKAIQPMIDRAISDGGWLVLAGHEIGDQPARQTTQVAMLEALGRYCRQRHEEIWLDTVANISGYILSKRQDTHGLTNADSK